MSLLFPVLVGTLFTADCSRAVVLGFIVYVIGGWLFGLLYFGFSASIGILFKTRQALRKSNMSLSTAPDG